LLIAETIWGLTPLLETAGYVIWGIFIIEFALGLTLAPDKLDHLKANWLKAIALVVPALRGLRVFAVFRAARVARVAGGARGLLRVISASNRGMRAFQQSMSRRGFGYVVGVTLFVTLAGAAGMYAFERQTPDGGFDSYGTALWWTAMIMTTMGSEYWPHTGEGRVLCFLLSLYAFAVFGYVTATLATFFIGRDADDEEGEVVGAKSIHALQTEIAALRTEIRALSQSTKS
ncbi:MAG: ion transporter, partial [Burkholderiaceae bacterium]